MDNEILQLVLTTLLQVFAPLIFGILAVIAWKAYQSFEAYLIQNGLMREYQIVRWIAEQLVSAAQQNGLTGKISDVGAEKKAWVMGEFDRELRGRGIVLDLEEMDNIIEAAYHDKFKLPPGPVLPPEV